MFSLSVTCQVTYDNLLNAGPKAQKKVLLDGPRSCGKSIALAMLVHWARSEGWLVLYVPKGREWTHGGFFYKNPNTGLWDTPVQAARVLQVRKFTTFYCSSPLA